ncbi:unannotated protein [freshwater metagenome]|uniref:Unannotated protein n=1 Tax=freshwater metagenome TaxID=449393 RepID=A0A6J7P1Y8_9ZZZZ
MGFNPHQKTRKSAWDYLFVASALLVAAGLLVWAFLG